MSLFENARRPIKRTKSSLLAFKLREVRYTLPSYERTRMPSLFHVLSTNGSQSCAPASANVSITCLFMLLSHSLASRLRPQFLDTKDSAEATIDMPLPKILEASNSVTPSRKAARTTPNPETVWVDCFYYGFYMEKARLPAFQASLRQHQQASRPQVAGS